MSMPVFLSRRIPFRESFCAARGLTEPLPEVKTPLNITEPDLERERHKTMAGSIDWFYTRKG